MIIDRIVRNVLLVSLLTVLPIATGSAQAIPETPVPGSAPTGVLAEFRIDELPIPHAEVWFIRMGLEPGGSLPAGTLAGPLVAYGESGVVTLHSDRPVKRATVVGEATPDHSVATPATGTVPESALSAGQSVLVDEGITLTITNETKEPATFLIVLMYPAEREGEDTGNEASPVGLTQQGISIANSEFPYGPGTLTIERLVVENSDTLTGDSGHGMSIGGVELGAIEQGAAEVTFMMGSSWLWPNILNQSQDRQPIGPDQTLNLTAGDGYSTYDGSSHWTVTSEEPLILLRLTITPES